ncbi:hypothetical protein G6F57_022615 [Rhizopus arrhizus]|nr:hypothetical protein G6F57_022615 [Rhizopus arrhizus]
MPRLAASEAFINTTAPAPSFRPDALPAVTVPFSFWKTGLSVAMVAAETSRRTCSSVSNTTSPLRVFCTTGTIWSRK